MQVRAHHIARVERYQTEDGSTFETLEDAIKHDDVMTLAHQLEAAPVLKGWPIAAEEVAKWLLENYEVTPAVDVPVYTNT